MFTFIFVYINYKNIKNFNKLKIKIDLIIYVLEL